ncbi:diguanylate cyclase [Massilia sp. ST3]|uniref:GGDEF domain-containing protein n=1 Tax=Massilia sp. ST3 TaxID=2824903 RepID=UPI001B811DD1|nr:GGDEF domain-containing protein [Massilia sp. ST3]MBQ5946096.1 GGDEF domain-containing protein [Massilia sp. ST3]
MSVFFPRPRGAPPAGAPGRGLFPHRRPRAPPLTPEQARQFDECADLAVRRLLPALGPALGACVLMLGVWDLLLGLPNAPRLLLLRLALVAAGALTWFTSRLPWSPTWRCAVLFATHTAALFLCADSVEHGLMHGAPALVASMLTIGLVDPRPLRCLLVLAVPVLAFAVLGALALPSALWLAGLAACGAALLLALGLSRINGCLRREVWLREQQLLDACRHDSLSGALSRAYVTELAERDLTLALRHGRPLAVAMIDIDHFKGVNDRHGHAAGDAVIRALVATCLRSLRGSDYIGRLGGEEFVCVMPETRAGEALACAERIRTGFAALRVASTVGPMRCTISIGVSVLERHGAWSELLRDADAALYQAKEAGRNRTLLSPSALRAERAAGSIW